MADPILDAARFAQQFKNTTNLQQRAKYARDITDANERDKQIAREEFEQLQIQNPEVGRLMLGREKAEQAARNQLHVRDLAERKFQWDMEKANRLENLNAKRLDLQMRQEDRMLKKAEIDMEKTALDMENELSQEEDMLGLVRAEREARQKYGTGTQAYSDSLLDAAVRFKHVDKDFRETILKRVGIPDPEAAFKQYSEMVAGNPGASVSGVPLPGGGRLSIKSPDDNSPKLDSATNSRLDRLTKEQAELEGEIASSKKHDPAKQKRLGYLNNEIKAIDELRQTESLKVAPGTQIDESSARKILELSGGDPAKAREKAAQLGYVIK